jgi:hypothetical protein
VTRLNWFGVALQVGGVLGAAYLLLRLRENITLRPVVPLSWFRAAWRWFRRVILRRPVKTTSGYGRGTFGLGGTLTARGHSVQQVMPGDLDTAEQIEWLEAWMRRLEQGQNALSDEVGTLAGTTGRNLEGAKSELRQFVYESVSQVQAEFRALLGGDIAWEVFFLLAIAVGTVLAVV